MRNKILVSMVSVLLFLFPSRANAEPSKGPFQTEKWVGTNYTPSYACNQVRFWHDFRADVLEKELAAARKYFALNTLRVYLHPINFEQDRENFFTNLETFLKICDKHQIKPGFVFFDDCHRHEGIFLDKPTEPVKGYHNGRWAASPQDRDRDIDDLERYRPYVREIVSRYGNDDRVLWWQTCNEPVMKNEFATALRKAAYKFAKEAGPKQPVLCCWDDSPETDIVNAHNYSAVTSSWDAQADLNPAKGCVFTEAGARWFAPRPSSGEPVEVIRWLETRKRDGKYVPGVYLCWELMVGDSNCRWYWRTPENTPEPTLPWCGLLWPDATPVSLAEAEAIRHYVTGETKALFFDDFQKPAKATPRKIEPTRENEWTVYESNAETCSGTRELGPMVKMVAGGETWKDIVLEAVVMLVEDHGHAGLIFRVNDPGMGRNVQAVNDFTGYYVGFDTKTLRLVRMNKGTAKLLETFSLEKLDCKVVPGVWNSMRIALDGARIRVWFNRMHPSEDPQNGLRFDFTDVESPILSGKIGLRTYATTAKFDNVIVLPIEELPEAK